MNMHGLQRVAYSASKLAMIFGLALMVVTLASCKGSGGASTSYLDAYHRGNYSVAKAQALNAYNGSTGSSRDQAGLIVGLSAQAQDQNAEAKRYLRPLLASQDPEIAGRAGAGLGLIARDEGDKASAARMLSEAAPKLKGDESAKAAMFAGDAYTSLGKPAEASSQYALAARAVKSPTLQAQIRERQDGKKFAVQAGAFATKANADKRAKEITPKSTAFGYGAPRVVASTSGGKSVFLVYVGEFGLRQDATEAMMKMKVPEGKVAEVP